MTMTEYCWIVVIAVLGNLDVALAVMRLSSRENTCHSATVMINYSLYEIIIVVGRLA